jgi:ferredoxin
MIGIYPFKDYEGFKELFVREDGRRKNAVLLKWLTSKEVRNWCIKTRWERGLTIRTMADLKDFVMARLRNERSVSSTRYDVYFMGHYYPSDKYCTDSANGLCEDRDYRQIRYVRMEDRKTFKMKASRMFMHLMECNTFGQILPDAVKLWICEEVQNDWEQYTKAKMPPLDDCTLVVGDDFARIYNGRYLKGDFGSCMTDREHHYFYSDSVKAKAAYMEDSDGKILARCVIFTEVKDDDTGEIFRLAERQYSCDCREDLKHDLVRMLIAGGHIDGYKRTGAGCHDANAFVDNLGRSMSERKLSIECTADYDSTISYQDSFKWYDMDENRAYNYYHAGADYELDTTNEYLEGSNYDEYHEEYTRDDTVDVYYGRWMSCNENRLDDFIYIEGEGYIHEEYCTHCEQCDEYFREGCGEYSSITGEDYCCESCREEAEREYKEEHWTYSEYDDEYFEDESDVVTLKRGACDEISICRDSADRLVDRGEAVLIKGKYYDAEWAECILDEA